MTYQGPYLDKDTTKLSHELCQIPDEVAHGRPAFGCLGKPRPYVVGSVGPLPGAELCFGLVSERDPDSFPLKLFGCRILGRATKRAPHYFDSFFFEGFPVVPVEIYLVSEKPLRRTAEPFLIQLYVDCQIGCFVIGLPAVVVDERVAVHYADSDFSPELDLGFGFASYYGTDMWLMYADNAVLTGMCSQAKHRLLLVIHVYYGLDGPFLRAVESSVGFIVYTYEIEQREDVAVKEREHPGDCILYKCRTFMPAFDDIEVNRADALTFDSRRLAYLLYAADLVDHAIDVFGAVFDKVYVGGITDFGVRTGC